MSASCFASLPYLRRDLASIFVPRGSTRGPSPGLFAQAAQTISTGKKIANAQLWLQIRLHEHMLHTR